MAAKTTKTAEAGTEQAAEQTAEGVALTVLKTFMDKQDNKVRHKGDEFTAAAERADALIKLGLAEA